MFHNKKLGDFMTKAEIKGIFADRLIDCVADKEEYSRLNQTRQCEEMHINKGTFSKWLNIDNALMPNYENLLTIARYYKVSIDYLLGLSDVKTTNPDIKMIYNYTGLSENAIYVLSENELKIKSLKKQFEENNRLFHQKMDSIKEQKEVLPKSEYDQLWDKEYKNFVATFGDGFDIEEELCDYENVKKFLDRLINSSLFKPFCAFTNEAIFCQAKELKLERYNDYLKKGCCKLSIELDEFKKAAAEGIEVDMEDDDDATDSSIYSAIKKYMRLIVDISNSIAENGELSGSFLF